MRYIIVYDSGDEFEKDSLQDLIESIVECSKDAESCKEKFVVKIDIPY